ncbi:drug/metabolite transporter (DMT)-like permease [Alkalihalobacillus xiaoxiensis]|uniref:Drug/metabolite transporter (DMT)-like permease n=1 Tax=Shouchella xiaoxiensis TaxID=766895 RepID=A0ABS2SZ37_9BACI|nr:DMT family transporter [Shouchella xiaoxiensis]MBM7839709.1 drug/metabolite transporter (DMT)-like permease [Shouchella xiaoxiensis]
MSTRTRMIASFYALLAVAFWGLSFVSTKALLTSLDPGTILVARFAIGALFLFILLLFLRIPLLLPVRYLPHLIILSILGVFVHQFLQATALLTIDASDAGWMIAFAPIFTCILSFLFLHERLTFPKMIGIVAAVCGVLMVTSNNLFVFSFDLGHNLMLLSTFNWAVYSILLKGLRIPLPPLTVTFYMCLIGSLLTVPFFASTESFHAVSTLEWGQLLHLLFLGIFVSGIAYYYWTKALQVLEANRVSSFLYIEPLVTLGAAILILHEKIILISILGGLILIGSVIFINKGFSTPTKRE